ncbi:MAG: prepilin-type N-terminal cleavage/methylation domain-containing protein [Candidatus Riflebacteria bacterium]|nr:prepilin-type N-terminal cleavage/methylation domain-containing protein [Candidatus Riflebacteria bacterium]
MARPGFGIACSGWVRGCGRGFTIVEILMAVTIFSFAVLPLALFVRSSSKTVEGTRDLAGAVFLAQKTLEQCRSYPPELLVRDGATPTGVETALEAIVREPTFTMGRITYKRQVEIRPVDAGAGFGGKLLHLKISWQANPQDKALEYETWTVLAPAK